MHKSLLIILKECVRHSIFSLSEARYSKLGLGSYSLARSLHVIARALNTTRPALRAVTVVTMVISLFGHQPIVPK